MGPLASRTAMKVESRTKAARNSKRKPFWKGQYNTAKKTEATPAAKKETRYYPAEDTKIRLTNSHNNSKQTKLRSSITPGTVVILLAGQFKGKRVVFLKQLASGLLLVTGPYKVNGVPLRRVPQSYVIATQTKLDISGVNVPEAVNDALFKKTKTTKKKSDEVFYNENDKETTTEESRKALQKQVDEKLVTAIANTQLLKAYLASQFSLKKGQKPHEMVF